MTTLDELNALDPDSFARALSGVFEHAEWVAAEAARARPFPTVAALHAALMEAVRRAPEEDRLRFLCGHPELGADKVDMTPDSRAEQAALGLDGSGSGMPGLNRLYRERFGIPFIVCVRRHTPANVLRVLERRLRSVPAAEHEAALEEVALITRLRLLDRVTGPGRPEMEGRLSTHVLDTAAGRPGAGMAVELLVEGKPAASAVTNADGRLDAKLLPPGPVRMGRYELRFGVGAYFAGRGQACFYDVVPIAFTISEPEGSYHVPLVASPWSYSTYRGS